MSTDTATDHAILTLSCPDAPGIVYTIAESLLAQNCTIAENQQFTDPDSHTFFTRVRFADIDSQPLDLGRLQAAFTHAFEQFPMTWRLTRASERPRVLILASKQGHCLNDLLFRSSTSELDMDTAAVVSNHPDLGQLADHYHVPFRHIPVSPDTKPQAEQALTDMINNEHIDLVILARYMQILSDELCKQLAGRAINIHHSMLPSFKGARPYRQAYERGVKLIGATAHYVTPELDEGPIIEQETIRVDHSLTADEFATRGREVESRTLARAVRLHTQNRVLRNGPKTVVFQ